MAAPIRSLKARMQRVIKGKIRQCYPLQEHAELRSALWASIVQRGSIWPVWEDPPCTLGDDDKSRFDWIQNAINARRQFLP